MSLRDSINAQLARPLTDQGEVLGPFRKAVSQAAVASPQVTGLSLTGTQLKRGDGIYIPYIWAELFPTAVMNVTGLRLEINDAPVAQLLGTIGTPVLTTVTGITGPTSVLFPPAGLITFEDLDFYGRNANAGGVGLNDANQPIQLALAITFSASTLAVKWGIKWYVVRGIQDG